MNRFAAAGGRGESSMGNGSILAEEDPQNCPNRNLDDLLDTPLPGRSEL
jgi:hypothetical protein